MWSSVSHDMSHDPPRELVVKLAHRVPMDGTESWVHLDQMAHLDPLDHRGLGETGGSRDRRVPLVMMDLRDWQGTLARMATLASRVLQGCQGLLDHRATL